MVRDHHCLLGLALRDPEVEPPFNVGGQSLLTGLQDDDANAPCGRLLLLYNLAEAALSLIEDKRDDLRFFRPNLQGVLGVELKIVIEA